METKTKYHWPVGIFYIRPTYLETAKTRMPIWLFLSRRLQQRERLSASMLSICLSVAKMQKKLVFDDWYTVGTVLVDLWRLVHQWSFFLFWLSFDCFWRLVHRCYTVGTRLGRHVTIGTPCHICCFSVFFYLLWRLAHGWYSLGRHVSIGTPMVIFAVYHLRL